MKSGNRRSGFLARLSAFPDRPTKLLPLAPILLYRRRAVGEELAARTGRRVRRGDRHDPATGAAYKPVNLNDPSVLAQHWPGRVKPAVPRADSLCSGDDNPRPLRAGAQPGRPLVVPPCDPAGRESRGAVCPPATDLPARLAGSKRLLKPR